MSPSSVAELGLRIRQAADRLGSRKAAADAAGVSPDQLSRYMRGENEPAVSIVARLAHAAKVSLEWLATGRGEMDLGAGGRNGAVADDAGVPGGFVFVKRYEVPISAGPGAIVGDEHVRDVLAFRADFVRSLGVNPATPDELFCFDAVGDSMKPTIEPGDTLTFTRVAGAPPTEGILAIGIGDALLVKRIQPVLGGIMILSDNPAYKPEALGAEEAKAVRVLGRLKVISRVL